MKPFVLLPFLFVLACCPSAAQTWKELDDQAESYYQQGKYDSALYFAHRAVRQAEMEFGKAHQNYGTSQTNVGVSLMGKGQFYQALPYLDSAVENAVVSVGKSDPEYGSRTSNLSSAYIKLGRFEDALSLLKEALDNAEYNFGKSSTQYKIRQNNLGTVYYYLAQYEEALPYYEDAFENLDIENPQYLISLSNLATLHLKSGHYEKSLSYFLILIQSADDMGLQKHPNYSIFLNNLASLYCKMGRYEEALQIYKKALENTETTVGKDNIEYGVQLNNLGETYRRMGQNEMARTAILGALNCLEKNAGKEDPKYGRFLGNLGVLYVQIDSLEKALSVLSAAKNLTGKALGEAHPEYGTHLKNLGELCRLTGKYEEASSYDEQALINFRESLGENHPDYGLMQQALAVLQWETGEYESALAHFKASNRNLHRQIESVFRFSSEQEKKEFLITLKNYYDQFQAFHYSAAFKFPEMAELVYDNQLLTKNLLLNTSKDLRKVIDQGDDSLTMETSARWLGLKRRLASEYAKPFDKRLSGIDSLETIANDLESQLVKMSQPFREQKNTLTWKKVQNQLKVNEAAIEFSAFHSYNKKWNDSIFYVAYILTKEAQCPKAVYLFEKRQLDSILDISGAANLYIMRGASPVRNDKRDSVFSLQLYKLIVAPIVPQLQGIDRIYFAADGALYQIAFAALPDSAGKLFGEKYELVQVSSTGNLVNKSNTPGKSPALLAGGINYDFIPLQTTAGTINNEEIKNIPVNLQNTRSNTISERWTYLKGTENEIKILSRLYAKAKLPAESVTKDSATEAYIKSLDGNSPKVLHLATHGFFYDGSEDISHASMAQLVYLEAKDPLLRSGLILAGANYAWKNGTLSPGQQEDGILTAYEISHLDLSNTDLVVLSACETALGDIEGSEGVYGLQRAFRMAGVDYLMMSLWNISDKETAEFMEIFYSRWLGGQPIRIAFLETQREMSRKYRDEPEKWAGFVLVE